MTPQEYAVRAVRAWVTNLDLDTVPELQPLDAEGVLAGATTAMRDRFVEQVLDAAHEMVGVYAYAVIAERQDEEWQRFRHECNGDGSLDRAYPVRFTVNDEIVR